MPLYEYECGACGHRFEQIQKFSDPTIEVCPKCGEPKVQKLLSSPAIQFKGSGWYITDYARKGSGDTKESGDTKKSGDAKETKDSKDAKESKGSKESKESKDTKETKESKPAAPATSSDS